MVKNQNFYQDLVGYINNTQGLAFEWGVRDCVTYAIGALELMIGRAVEKPDFGYRTKEEAFEFAQRYSLAVGMRAQLGAYEVTHRFHQPGDIAIVQRHGLECAHVVLGKHAFAPLLGGAVTAFDMQRLYLEAPEVLILRFD